MYDYQARLIRVIDGDTYQSRLLVVHTYYQARLIRVIDGDTVDVEIDLGFDCRIRERLRLHGINAPEMRKDDQRGELAKDHLERLLGNSVLRVRTEKGKEKYGRYLAKIYVGEVNINGCMVTDGHAVEATY